MKTVAISITLALVTLLSPAGAQLQGQLGVLDPENASGGINPATGLAWALGDQYRLAFYTQDKRNALSDDIADYNTFVQEVAAGSTRFAELGSGTWKVLGSTATVSAKRNTGTETDDGLPIFVLDGVTMIAASSEDMWDGFGVRFDDPLSSPTGQVVFYSPYLNEDGEEIDDPGFPFGTEIATGTTNTGDIASDPLGDPNMDGQRLTVGASQANTASRVWLRFGNRDPASEWSFYVLSDPLMVSTGQGNSFAITRTEHNAGADEVTLTWTARADTNYIAKVSTDMTNWDFDMGDQLGFDVDENTEDGDFITVTFSLADLLLEDASKLFFRIEIGG